LPNTTELASDRVCVRSGLKRVYLFGPRLRAPLNPVGKGSAAAYSRY